MTHLHSKRLPDRGRVLAAVTALAASFAVGAFTPAEAAGPGPESHRSRSDRPHDFTSLAEGATGGAGGRVVTVTDRASAAAYPQAAVPALVSRFSGPQQLGANTVLNVPADYPTVQAAVDAVPSGNDGTVTIRIAPGTYREKVHIPANKPNVVLQGTGQDRSDTVIVYDTPAEYGGSTGSATVRIDAGDVTARHLTFSNDFDEAAHELNGEQALAVKTTGDRIVFEDTAFLGNQDTLMTDSPKLDVVSRVYIRDSYIEGDVDFIYGRATTVIERSVIRALSRGSTSNNGYITAASTWKNNPYGFLVTKSRVVSDAPAGTFHLGRPWHPGGEPDAVAQVLFRETELPAAVKSSPWTDMSGFSWKDARFAEYGTYGPGAGVTADRPQLPDADADTYTVARYLAGTDGWAPGTDRR